MKSDPHFYKIFMACPELFVVFAPIDMKAEYRFASQAFKEIDRTYDGIFEPVDKTAPTYIIEYQVELEANVYPRIFLEMSGYQLEHMDREVRGIVIFLCESSDPKLTPWWNFSQGCGEGFCVVYLDRVLAELTSDHPLVATFKPLVEHNKKNLKQQALECLQNIRKADLKPNQKAALEDVFLSWLTQRFKSLTKKEITAMFGFDTPVEETVFYKEVLHEGEMRGEIRGKIEGIITRITKEISSYQQLHEQGYLPLAVYEEKVKALNDELLKLQQKGEKLA